MATVGTAITARISAGMIVQPISSGVLPWICFGLSSLALAVAEPQRDVDRGDEHERCRSTTRRSRRSGMKRLSILLGVGPLGCERVLAVVVRLGTAGEDEGDGRERGHDGRGRQRAGAVSSCVTPCLLPAPPATCAASTRSAQRVEHSSHADFAGQQLVQRFVNSEPEAVEGVGAALPVALDPHPGLEVARGRRAAPRARGGPSVPASLSTAPPWPITIPFCDSRSTRIDDPERAGRRPGRPLARLVLVGLDLLGDHRDRVRQLVACDRGAAARAAARRRGTSRAGR